MGTAQQISSSKPRKQPETQTRRAESLTIFLRQMGEKNGKSQFAMIRPYSTMSMLSQHGMSQFGSVHDQSKSRFKR
jgi:hypothetical protein